jgi:SAM-dependent methyltransferase
MPTAAALADFYGSYYTPAAHDGTAAVTFDNSERFGAHLGQVSAPFLNKPELELLDFGGGDGTLGLRLAEYYRARGVERVVVTVVDYNETVARSADTQISMTVVRELAGIPAGAQFDFVIASASIEHLPDPGPVLDSLMARLRPGGMFYARTPWVVPFVRLGRLVGARVDFTYPAHLHDLGRPFWEGFVSRWSGQSGDIGLRLILSKPSIVETVFSQHALRTAAAIVFKAPWYLGVRGWSLVGGWEIFCLKAP